MLLFVVAIISGLLSCSDPVPKENENRSVLQLNSDCKSFVADTILVKALQDGNLSKVKSSLQRCASTNIEKYKSSNNSLPASLLEIPGVLENDSLAIYLLNNGEDSVGRNLHIIQGDGLLTLAAQLRSYDLVHYLLASNYTVDPRAAWWAISYNRKGLYDTLMTYISVVDSIKNYNVPALTSICNDIINNPTYAVYFYDLLAKGASPDIVISDGSLCTSDAEATTSKTPLFACIGWPEQLVKDDLAKALVKAGANPLHKSCNILALNQEEITSPIQLAHLHGSDAIISFLDSVVDQNSVK